MGAEIKPEPTPEEREAILLALAGSTARKSSPSGGPQACATPSSRTGQDPFGGGP